MKTQQQLLQRHFQDLHAENVASGKFKEVYSEDFKKFFAVDTPSINNRHFNLPHLSVYTMGNFFIAVISFPSIPGFSESYH